MELCLPQLPRPDHRACVSIKLPNAEAVDRWHNTLAESGLTFQRMPADYPWDFLSRRLSKAARMSST